MSQQTPIDFEDLFRQDRSAGSSGPGGIGRWWLLVVLLLVLLFGGGWIVDTITEWWWFQSLGQADVFQVRLLAPLALFGVVGLIGAVWLVGNGLWATRRVAGQPLFAGQERPAIGRRATRGLVLGLALVAAVLVAAGVASAWSVPLLYLNQQPFGTTDPLFGLDVSFYVFELPLWQLAHAVAWSWLVTALVGVVAVYVFGGLLELRGAVEQGVRDLAGRATGGASGGGDGETSLPSLRVPGYVRTHLALLVALGALLWSAGHWLDRFGLLFAGAGRDTFFGPGYTDLTVRLPAHEVLAVGGIVVALLILLSLRIGRWWLPSGAAAVVFGAQIVLLGAVPAFVQQYRVQPNELALERPYIEHNIELTRRAYDLEGITTVSYDPTGDLTEELLEQNRPTIENIRLWDWRALLDTFRQLQEIRTYYDFLDVDIDRYTLDTGVRQVELAVRELTPSKIPNRTWVNLHLEYTHGIGAVVAPVDEVDSRGLPVLWSRDIPPVTEAPFDRELTQPRVYFGQADGVDYVIVGTSADELDYAAAEGNVRTSYDGASGVPIGSPLRRALFALRFGDSEILFADQLTEDSRVHMHRRIERRAAQLAPFLRYDPDAYAVLTDDGRIVWLYDAYTVTGRYPYSRPLARGGQETGALAGASYVRNSVKVAIDAYDGTVTYYIVDPDDPLIAAWAEIFPTLFRPAEEMSDNLVDHWRYPEALFRAQADVYARYHMTLPETFYNAEDLWEIPTETLAQGDIVPVEPYYVIMQLRNAPEAEFLLMQPYTPAGKPNLIAWMAARSDAPNYGELVTYEFAKGEQFFGPQQIEVRIDQNEQISEQLTLWNQSGSSVIRGNLLVIPVGDALLYVEPLYLRAESGALPELKQVIVADIESVVMRPTLDEALEALLAGRAPLVDQAAPPPEDVAAATPGPRPTAAGTPATPSEDVSALIRSAAEHEAAARDALQAGDWSAFGREMDALTRDLADLATLTGGPLPPGVPTPPPGTATPAPTATPEAGS